MLVALLLGGILRLWLALGDYSVYWPDEIFKSLEPAHWLASGDALLPWEFVEGANNWVLPGLLAGVLRLCGWLGLDDPQESVNAIRVLFSMASLGAAYGAYRLARTYQASPLVAACGAAMACLAAPAVFFAPKALSETASALPVVLGLAFVLRRPARGWELVLGSSLLGFASVLRLQNALFCIGVLTVLVCRRDWRAARVASMSLAGWTVALGLLDKLTWGGWFHSTVANLRFNVFENGASGWGTDPFLYYVHAFTFSIGPAFLLLAPLALLAFRRAPGLLFTVLGFCLVHSLVPHKELRFLIPALPPLCALAAVGADTLARSTAARRALPAAMVTLAVLSAALVPRLSFGDVGQGRLFDPRASAYSHSDEINRLLFAAHRRRDLCGLKLEGDHIGFSGGYSYLDRDVRFYHFTGPPWSSGFFNYVIAARDRGPTTTVVASAGRWALMRLPNRTCLPDPLYHQRMRASGLTPS